MKGPHLGSSTTRCQKRVFNVIKEHPLLGVGSKHYIEHIQRYVEQGRVHPIIGRGYLATPHTLIAEIAVSKGSLGIIIFITFIFNSANISDSQRDGRRCAGDVSITRTANRDLRSLVGLNGQFCIGFDVVFSNFLVLLRSLSQENIIPNFGFDV